jgi:hypothetical protein
MNDPDPETRAAEAEALLRIYVQNWKLKGLGSQEDFGRRFHIGNQSMVSQYLHNKRPLNLAAAMNFAGGLKVEISDFSPRLFEFGRELVKGIPRFEAESVEPINPAWPDAGPGALAGCIGLLGRLLEAVNESTRKSIWQLLATLVTAPREAAAVAEHAQLLYDASVRLLETPSKPHRTA